MKLYHKIKRLTAGRWIGGLPSAETSEGETRVGYHTCFQQITGFVVELEGREFVIAKSGEVTEERGSFNSVPATEEQKSSLTRAASEYFNNVLGGGDGLERYF